MPRTQDAEERPDNPVHFHRLDNRSSTAVPDAVLPPPSMESCIVLPSDI
jgi:hypothetical protein